LERRKIQEFGFVMNRPTRNDKDLIPSIEEIVEAFEDLPEFDERVDYIIDLGRELPTASESLHSPENLVSGCMSTVWLRMNMGRVDEPVTIEADSDSQIIRGLLVILLAFYRDKTPAEIVAIDVGTFLKQLELDQHLSPQRRNGLFAMVKRINALALAVPKAS
jgi:cysteine desulfuration protein SufE